MLISANSPEFINVAAAFHDMLATGNDLGAGLCIYREGVKVVETAGGYTTLRQDAVYRSDSLQMVFSITKAVLGIAAGLLMDDGTLDPDTPVCAYWSAFEGPEKNAITVRQLLAHQSGLLTFGRRFYHAELLDWELMTTATAHAKPMWRPGTQHGYHVLSYGWLVGRLIEKVSGMPLAHFIRERITEPLDIPLLVGVPQEKLVEVVPITDGQSVTWWKSMLQTAYVLSNRRLWQVLTFGGSITDHGVEYYNRVDVLAAVMPSFNGVSTAPALAKLFHALMYPVNGRQLLSEKTLTLLTSPHSAGPDHAIGGQSRFGLGLMLDCDNFPLLSPTAYGHYGISGSVVFNDPTSKLTVAYVTNLFSGKNARDARVVRLLSTLRQALNQNSDLDKIRGMNDGA